MNVQTQSVIDTALALSEAERAIVVERLLESLSPVTSEATDEELYAELERRHAEFEQDPSVAIPWSELEKED